MLNIVSNDEMVKQEQQAAIAAESLNAPLVLTGVAGHISKCWEAARTQKQPVKDRILKSQRARRGEYDPKKLSAIRETGGSEEYGRVTGNKCRVAESWLRDVYLGQAEKAWTLKHTPYPNISPEEFEKVRNAVHGEIMEAVATFGVAPPQSMIQARLNELEDGVRMRLKEEAKLAVERMEDKMADQMAHAGFSDEWAQFLNDFVTYPAAHFKGPILRKREQLDWVQEDGTWSPKQTTVIEPEFERVDPLRAYPAPGATSPQDLFFIEHITLQRKDLHDLIGLEGFDEKAIRAVLKESEGSGLYNWLGLTDVEQSDSERGELRWLSPMVEIDCLEFYGPIQGQQLVDWGVDEDEIEDMDRDYECCAWLIGRHVIKVQMNPDPLGKRPIHKACWEEIPGEYWGVSLPDALEDVQGVVNAAIRSLVNNMGMGSGPQVVVNVDRLPPGESIQSLKPWNIWQVNDSQYGSTGAAIEFFQPDTKSSELIAVLEKFYQFADDWSLIPRYMQGSDNISGSVGRTASGLSMLFNAANKGLKGVVSTIDTRVLAPMLSMLYTYNMLFDKDETIKGDAQVVARGAVALMQMETLQLRRNEFLQATSNPIDSQIVGPEGRAEILREVAKGLEMDVNRVVPRRGTVPPPAMGGEQQAPMPQQNAAAGAPNQEMLMNGAAVTDNFSPTSMQ
jgi:hypothetical protein